MSRAIQKTCVIGAGQMGAQIAAQMANGGLHVMLLDVEKAQADHALHLLEKAKPAAFMSPKFATRIETGSIRSDLVRVKDCDWVLEAIIEDKTIKQSLYQQIHTVRKPGSILSTNTSTLRRADLLDGQDANLRENFFITHFFNPPRYMRLLECVSGPENTEEAQAALQTCCSQLLGKTVINCHDTPGFLANRLGIFWLYTALSKTIEYDYSVEEADRLLSKPFGIPKTGIFGLMDLVGIDLMPFVSRSLAEALDPDDPFVQNFRPIELIDEMIQAGQIGRKGTGGFYRLNAKVKESRNLKTGAYHPCGPKRTEKRKAAQLMQQDRLVRDVMGATLRYACHLIGSATDQIQDLDDAMKLGYNWKAGPFELIDQIGAHHLIQQDPAWPLLDTLEGQPFYQKDQTIFHLGGTWKTRPEQDGVLRLSELKAQQKPLLENPSARLWDIGEGVACLEFSSHMNMIDPLSLELAGQSVEQCAKAFRGLVLYNDGANFSIGANLGLALFQANIAAYDSIDQMVTMGQEVMQALKYAPFPVIGAPHGMALGGGCEFLLHCDAVVAHAESYIGLVETGVGLIPAWGGLKEMLGRWASTDHFAHGPIPAAQKTFETVGLAQVSTSAYDAMHLGFLKPDSRVIMNRDHVLFEARSKAISLAQNYSPPKAHHYHLGGPSAKAAFELGIESFVQLGKASAHDQHIMGHLGAVLSGGPHADLTQELDETTVLGLERQHFMKLVRHPATLERIEHMVLTHKPLRN